MYLPRYAWPALGLFGLLLLGGCSASDANRHMYRIAVIPKGTTHDFWKYINAGAIAAVRDKGTAKIIWEGPAKEDQRLEQQQIVERFTSEKVDAIVLAPCDRQTLVAPVEEALRQGIPVVIIDSGLKYSDAVIDSPKYLGYVGTDNHQGGVEAAKRMIELFKDKDHAKVLMIRYQAGSESTELREAGFRDTIKTKSSLEFIEAADEAGATVDSAQKVAERILSDRKDIDGIFVPNESSTTGVLRALEVLKRAGDVKLVGFDCNKILVEALASGKIHGLVLQDPFGMAREGVKRAIDFLDGKPPAAKTQFTLVAVLTKENMNQRNIKPLWDRNLAEYLGE
jgi:ribose transport system substrate-binding protein